MDGWRERGREGWREGGRKGGREGGKLLHYSGNTYAQHTSRTVPSICSPLSSFTATLVSSSPGMRFRARPLYTLQVGGFAAHTQGHMC